MATTNKHATPPQTTCGQKRKRDDSSDEEYQSHEEHSKRPRGRPMMLEKVISGGQTGADRGALEAAEALGIATGGTAPFEYITCNGKDLELATRFHLSMLPRMPLRAMYVKRSCANVDNSDATIVFRLCASVGSDKTIGYCRTGKWRVCADATAAPYRPVFVVTALDDANKTALGQWLQRRRSTIRIVNVAGHRETSAPAIEGFTSFKDAVRQFLSSVWQARMR
jgi:hypothetical protein